ncbi:heterokaryon incompatibility protein-domain-containing protein [Exophiala viscosa]|uniref:heterokaryon incompatibility protein-domain-containing protein n=1 Tax=Exophiala viscosa TaxID=2486360 RepID=UPI00218F38A4|nr:heterokaryon incompatibility protein-domain-containing protein [Exophiala viscosa]
MPAARSRRKRIHSGQPGNATQAWSRPQQLSEVSDIYQHRPLNDVSSIRLVELLPGLIGNELTLAMHHADLKEPPPYQALSYYWGDPAPVRTIHVNVPKTYVAGQEFHLYWTDALCINQNDVQERDKQVRHMDIVYRQAKCVIAWLGRSSSYEEDLQIISLVAEGIWPGWLAEPPASALSQQKGQKTSYPTEGMVVAGSQSIPLDHFLFVLRSNQAGGDDYGIWEFSRAVDWIRRIRRCREGKELWSPTSEQYWAPESKHLWQLLSQLRCKSSDPRDIVYALLAIAPLGNSSTPAVERISIDYTKDMSDVFWDAVLECEPPWDQYDHLFHGLTTMMCKSRPAPDVLALSEYAEKGSTSQRHMEGAKVALEVCAAIWILQQWLMAEFFFDEDGTKLNDFTNAIKRLSETIEFSRRASNGERTYLESSLMLGFALARREDPQYSAYCERVLHPVRSTGSPSPWRCCTHRNLDATNLWGLETWNDIRLSYGKDPDLVLYDPVPPLWTLCGMCTFRSVHGYHGPGSFGNPDWGLSWRIPETRFYLIVDHCFHTGFSVGLHERPRVELRMRLELMQSYISAQRSRGTDIATVPFRNIPEHAGMYTGTMFGTITRQTTYSVQWPQ